MKPVIRLPALNPSKSTYRGIKDGIEARCRMPTKAGFNLHFDVRFEQRSNRPLHLRLTLPHAKMAVAGRDAYYGGWLIAAALLKVFRRIGSIDVEPSIKWLNGDHKVHGFQVVRHFRIEVDRAITWVAREYGDKKKQCRHDGLSASSDGKSWAS